MKRLAFAVVMVALVVGLFGAVALAGSSEETVFAYLEDENGDVYVARTNLARVWRIAGPWQSCCNADRKQEVEVRVHVAQWACWGANYAGWDWYVKKPGDYFANCIEGWLQSNGSVIIGFEGFANPYWEGDGGIVGTPDVEMWFAATQGSIDPDTYDFNWISAEDLNEFTHQEPNTVNLHNGVSWKLWNRINVVNCNSPGDYVHTAFLTLTLANQVDWIEDGDWGSPTPPNAPTAG